MFCRFYIKIYWNIYFEANFKNFPVVFQFGALICEALNFLQVIKEL